MYSDENKISSLAKFLSNYDYVFVDTCSLMEDGFPPFMDMLVASKEYWKDGLHVIVPEECIKELKKHKGNKEKEDARIGAIRALKILRHDQWHGKTIEIEKNITDGNFGDQAITQRAVGLRIKYKILVITQDKTLTNDLLKLNNLDSQRGHYLEVYKIMASGELSKNLGESGYSRPIEKKVKQRHSFSLKSLFKGNDSSKKREKGNDSSFKKIKEADQKIASTLNNNNYPTEKKMSDINAQIASLSKLSSQDKNRLALLYGEDELLAEKEKIIKKNLEEAKETKEAKNETLFKTNNRNSEDKETQNEFVISNEDLETLLRDSLSHFGVLIRDDSVPYLSLAHGPVDLVESAFSSSLWRLLPFSIGEKKTISFGDIFLKIERTKTAFIVNAKIEKTLQKRIKKEDKKEAASTQKTTEFSKEPRKMKKKETKTEKKAMTKKKMKTESTNHKRTANEIETQASSGPIVANDGASVLPSGVTLFVGEPSRKSYAPKKMKSQSKKDVKESPKGKIEKAALSKKKQTPIKPKKAKAKDDNGELLKAAKAIELRLNANLANPTYPLANKIRDIDAQIELLTKLSSNERKQLKLNHAELTKKKQALIKK